MGVFNSSDILLPKCADMSKWSVVACDQYTSQPEYWDRVGRYTDGAYSSFKLILPEAYLAGVSLSEKTAEVNSTMRKYLDDGIFTEYKDALVFVRRTFKTGLTRCGLIGAVDLEEYSYAKDSHSKIRATEATVAERIPARVTIRRNAPLELPHILLLIDDATDSVLGALRNAELKKLYDFDLMEDGGHIEGYLVSDNQAVLSAVDTLSTDPLIAVGDGNHSLAGAKACWEELKATLSPEEAKKHPMRYALCELVNLRDDSLVFEPIYRVFFGCEATKLISEMRYATGKYIYSLKYVTEKEAGGFIFRSDCHVQSGAVTEFLEKYAAKYGGRIDYIHGEDTAKELGSKSGNIAFMVDCLKKEELFKTVNCFGPLPKKTFSMGNAEEKRFYTEARRLVRNGN